MDTIKYKIKQNKITNVCGLRKYNIGYIIARAGFRGGRGRATALDSKNYAEQDSTQDIRIGTAKILSCAVLRVVKVSLRVFSNPKRQLSDTFFN